MDILYAVQYHLLHSYVVAAAVGIFIAGFSTIMTSLNFIATIHRMRAPGLTWFRLPIFIWSMYANSVIHRSQYAGAGDHDW